jgi:hypothetical protein
LYPNKKKTEVKWAGIGLALGAGVGAILGIVAYNQQWLG